ncbi:winged helix-turn-helix transcriptional regulator [Spirulina major]|uniref:winged helix-turn-helix transcriptional regulator n=1 Tax=Spirulina major TaxID=270636 RepID=UPI0009335911|nr:helix-turn-helix domain-containing protein [Spirulina major]
MVNPDRCAAPVTQCPIQYVVDLLGNKWSILILRELFGGDRRTHELLKALPGISTKTLSARLRTLTTHGLAERRVYAEVPPRVEYALTPKGESLRPVLAALHTVGSQWLAQDPCACPLTGVESRPTHTPLL